MWIWIGIIIILSLALIGFIIYHFVKLNNVNKKCNTVGVVMSPPDDKMEKIWTSLKTRLWNIQQQSCRETKSQIPGMKDDIKGSLALLKTAYGSNQVQCDAAYNMIRSFIEASVQEESIPSADAKFYINEVLKFMEDVIDVICKKGHVDVDEMISVIYGVMDSVCPGTSQLVK